MSFEDLTGLTDSRLEQEHDARADAVREAVGRYHAAAAEMFVRGVKKAFPDAAYAEVSPEEHDNGRFLELHDVYDADGNSLGQTEWDAMMDAVDEHGLDGHLAGLTDAFAEPPAGFDLASREPLDRDQLAERVAAPAANGAGASAGRPGMGGGTPGM